MMNGCRAAILKKRGASWLVLRFVMACLLVPLALSSALPMFARALGQEAHVCHCEIRGGESTCSCPICHPDREDFRFSEESIRGRCGDDDEAFGAALGFAVLPAPCVSVIGPIEETRVERAVTPPPRAVDLPIASPPPKRAAA